MPSQDCAMTDEDRERRAQHMGRLAELVARTRYDPDKLAAVKRSISGKTRCPACDELNRANQKSCIKCGAYLYPEMRDEDEEKEITQGTNKTVPRAP